MKPHLVRLAKRQGQARSPGLEGFLIVDLRDHSYLHLRKGPHQITPSQRDYGLEALMPTPWGV